MPVRMKTCSKCGEKKKLTEFHVASSKRDGHQPRCKLCNQQTVEERNEHLSREIFRHYGKACACCGSTGKLTLDHVNSNGLAHRELLGRNGGPLFYSWLIAQKFPPECEPGGEFELQPLCNPCNNSKHRGTHCRMHCKKHPECLKYFPGSPSHHRKSPRPRISPLLEVIEGKAERDIRIVDLWEQGLKQADIAKEVGCNQATVSRVLNLG